MSEKHIVGLSGGKDSTALALRLAETEPRDYIYVCTPTGDEMPEMVAHWVGLGKLLRKPILPVTLGRSLNGEIERQKCLPNAGMRWCTRMLKIEPMKQFLLASAPCVHYVGLRADEEEREGIYGEITGVTQRYPLREWGWGVRDVWDYIAERGVTIPRRTDCRRCYDQSIAEWYLWWKSDPQGWAEAEEQERITAHTFRSVSRDTWPAGLADLREQFERGRKIPRLNQHLQLRLTGETRENTCRVCTL